MRQSDENKKIAIGKAAIQLINSVGFDGASISKIAKVANVSPATIYTYFENKEDMLLKLYVMVKKELAIALLQGLDESLDIKKGIHLMFESLIAYSEKNIESFAFKEQFANCPLVANVCEDEELRAVIEPLKSFIEKGKRQNILKEVSIEYIGAYLFHPISTLIKRKYAHQEKLTEEEKNLMFAMGWDAIRK